MMICENFQVNYIYLKKETVSRHLRIPFDENSLPPGSKRL